MRDASSRPCKARRLLLVAALLCGTSVAAAQPSQVLPWRLDYAPGPDAPKNCPDKSYIKAALATKLKGHDPFTDDAPRSISVKLVLTPQRIEAHIEARDENGEVVANHVTQAESWRCDQLADRTVFYLRDIIDPLKIPPATSAQSSSSATPAPSAPSSATLPPVPPTRARVEPFQPAAGPSAPKAAARSEGLPQLAVYANMGAAWWSTPETALSLAAGMEARWKWLSIGVEWKYDYAWALPTKLAVDAERAGVAALACGRHVLFPPRVSARACVFGDVALLSLDAQRIKLVNDDDLVLDFGARLGGEFRLARFLSLQLHGDIAYAARRPVFIVDGEEFWRSPRLTGAVRVGVVVPFDIR
ncbi:hypothetical protein [Polyangium jinanense]|uniref:Uncharacterized protein n=1 Tax=Polyangium jinanense TaxID=2829994 RepID=A0A9X3X9I0_9BACT|nr:hypothetical protein [Polyangium jinanense]MDC3959637.1 hypothetical protein [Polyangium jinanense]MDC3986514.1 hypothetical protein [Polyangium jinanense]